MDWVNGALAGLLQVIQVGTRMACALRQVLFLLVSYELGRVWPISSGARSQHHLRWHLRHPGGDGWGDYWAVDPMIEMMMEERSATSSVMY